MRLGVFGGSFDPVHGGHLALAAACREQARLDRVLFVPAARQPLKPHGPEASDGDRVAMLEAATAGQSAYAVSTIEIDRGGTSYTIDTLREIQRQYPSAELFFLMGEDSLADFSHWREPQAILQLACPLVVRRTPTTSAPGSPGGSIGAGSGSMNRGEIAPGQSPGLSGNDPSSTHPIARQQRQQGDELFDRILTNLSPFASTERMREIEALRVEMPPMPIASSDIQRRIQAGEAWESLVPEAVAAIIRARGLYGA